MSETPAAYRARRATPIPSATSEYEALFLLHCRAARLPTPEREWCFAPPRRWRFDFSWPEAGLAVEIDGGTWAGGRHTRGAGFARDCEKFNYATLAGWRVLRFTAQMVADGTALETVRRALGMETTR